MSAPTTGPTAKSGLATVAGRRAYLIADLDQIDPFLIAMVSDGDRWAFLSSTGALTAGRRNPDHALFPYETDDRLHLDAGTVGPVSALGVRNRDQSGDETIWWRPYNSSRPSGRRWIAKAVVGDAVTFGDSDPNSGLAIEWTWTTADEFGFIRTATLTNTADEARTIDIIDGIVGVMPGGLPATTYQRVSNLSNAYRRSELSASVGYPLAVYSLEAPVSDQAEPEEVLRANVVWHTGLDGAAVTVDSSALDAVRDGSAALDDIFDRSPHSRLVTGRPGAYLVRKTVELEPGAGISWQIVGDVGLSHADIVSLKLRLAASADLGASLNDAARHNHDGLHRLMALADSQQFGSDGVVTAHHLSNVTYNVLRGGVPLNGYSVDVGDFANFLQVRNRAVLGRHRGWLETLGPTADRQYLLDGAAAIGDPDLQRLCLEYLPFSFSRRHGDPSRPWNRFDIRVRDEAGEPVVHFEGNWRDVFQNWEALCASFPDYLPGVVSLFVNASTADGYNAYRIGRDGIDWEVPDPDDPWANIGYWGDHQIVYLLRLLRQCDRYLPGALAGYLAEPIFTYADVPYRIADYDQMVADPRATIDYDEDRADAVARRVDVLGADGKLLTGPDGELVRVTLIEKLLVAVLAKLVNFVPGAGIWMNTQRPEWNDANNALVGYGASMVTLMHVREFLAHLADIVLSATDGDAERSIVVSSEIADWFDGIDIALDSDVNHDADRERRIVMDALGRVGTNYRTVLASRGLSGATGSISVAKVIAFCDRWRAHLDRTIESNWRSDGCIHSYNLLQFGLDEVAVKRLPLMLEGQVAAIAAAPLSDDRRADLVEHLFTSDLFRPDQQSFVLMAAPALASFLDRNLVPDGAAPNPLLAGLLEADDRSIVAVDAAGDVRFHADATNAAALDQRLRQLCERDRDRWSDLVSEHRNAMMDLYELTFQHNAYLGRSGSMHAYEGIGSIYWHMVTKLLLAIQEAAFTVADGANANDVVVERLVASYRRVRDGLGFRKSAVEFGAIPIDPYSHTPRHAGAQQPGMTGAVKEELLARWAEVGIRVIDGQLVFDARFVDADEPVTQTARWSVDSAAPAGAHRVTEVEVPTGSIASTCCQVPVVVTVDSAAPPAVTVEYADGTTRTVAGSRLDPETSRAIFRRSGLVSQVRAVVSR